MASVSPVIGQTLPDFINFLFSSKPKFDCYFEVGNKSQGKPERIGAVKLMLMSHSEVFRLELEDSELKDKGDVPLVDVHPDTFRGLLKYVYGHDTTSDMCFDEADNLLYVAEKYMMKTLKDKLALRLMKLLDPNNICSLLNNPACYKHLELDSAITEILRYETDLVLASPEFLWMNADGFLKILQQDGLAVPEIELWRAAIKWAKHRAESEDGHQLRQQLSGLTGHLRVSSLTIEEVCCEVLPTDVLTRDEAKVVCQSVGRKEKPQGLSEFSSETQPRKLLQGKDRGQHELVLAILNTWQIENTGCVNKRVYNFTLLTKKERIELLPLTCWAVTRGDPMMREAQKIDCTTTITKIATTSNTGSSLSSDPPITVTFSEHEPVCMRGGGFKVPLAVDGRNVTLQPDTIYTVRMEMDCKHLDLVFNRGNSGSGSYSNDHLTLAITQSSDAFCTFPSNKLCYRAIPHWCTQE